MQFHVGLPYDCGQPLLWGLAFLHRRDGIRQLRRGGNAQRCGRGIFASRIAVKPGKQAAQNEVRIFTQSGPGQNPIVRALRKNKITGALEVDPKRGQRPDRQIRARVVTL